MNALSIMERYAWTMVGTLYLWGGDDPSGWDCSGAAQEILSSVGEDPAGDQSAQAYFDYFRSRARLNTAVLGSLAFYGRDVSRVSHVSFCISPLCCIEAGGGDSSTTTRERAIEQNAFVRVRPIRAHKDLLAVLRPSYNFET